jgi:hypothetical protein
MPKTGNLIQPSNIDPYKRGKDYPSQDDNLESFIDNWERYSKRLIMFLGAGASIGAINKLGNKLPQAYELRNEIYREFMLRPAQREGFDFQNLGLMSLEQVAALAVARCDRTSVEGFVAERFTIERPLWQHAVLSFLRPLAIFTTNYDNLVELGWQSHASFGDLKPLVPHFKKTSRLNDNFVPLYKSHGSVQFPHDEVKDGGLVLTQFDYFEMIPHRKDMLDQFTTDFNEYCVVFIGYSFQDVDLASRLYEIRKDRRGKNWYAVFPRNNADVRKMFLEEYKILQITRTFLDFLVDLDKEVNFIPDEWKFHNIENLARQGLIYGGDAKLSKTRPSKKKCR